MGGEVEEWPPLHNSHWEFDLLPKRGSLGNVTGPLIVGEIGRCGVYWCKFGNTLAGSIGKV